MASPDYWYQLAVSNLCVSGALALVAFAVQVQGRFPRLAHVLWLLVMVKLVTPPVFTMPIIPVATEATTASTSHRPTIEHGAMPLDPEHSPAPTITDVERTSSTLPRAIPEPQAPAAEATLLGMPIPSALLLAWLAGSALIAVWSLTRLARFHRLLLRSTTPASTAVAGLARGLAAKLGLRRVPIVLSSPASITPFVWWMGGRTRVIVPRRVLDEFPREDLRMVLAHEFAHIRRRDHWVRWLEWLTCVAFWWNPIAWWARHNVRINEELDCDMLVLETLKPDRHSYAHSLLNVAEFLSTQAIRPPAVASAMTSGGKLEERLTMILSNKLPRTPRWLLSSALAIGAGVLPLSVAYGQDVRAVANRLERAVKAGELNEKQAKAMLEALRRTFADNDGRRQDPERQRDKGAANLERAARRFRAAVERGDMTPQEAREKLAELRERTDDAIRERERANEERYKATVERAKAAIERGELSREEAEKKLIELRKQMSRSMDSRNRSGHGDRRDDDRRADRDAKIERYRSIAERVRAEIKKGRLTPEEAEKKLAKIRGQLFRSGDPERREADRRRDADAERKRVEGMMKRLKMAVARGDISAQDARKRMAEFRKQMTERERDERRGERNERRREDRERMERDRERNEPRREDRERMERDRERNERRRADRERGERDGAERRLQEYVRRIRSAVERGEITAKDAERKMVELRKQMAEKRRDDRKGRDARMDRDVRKDRDTRLDRNVKKDRDTGRDDAALKRYEAYEARIKEALKRGELRYEEAEKKILEARKKMGESKKRAASAKTRYDEAIRRIKTAVDRGELSREEAEKKLYELRKKTSIR